MKQLFRMMVFAAIFVIVHPIHEATAARMESNRKDEKGSLVIFIVDTRSAPRFAENARLLKDTVERLFAAGENVPVCYFASAAEPDAIAKEILALPPEKLKSLGGIVEICFEDTRPASETNGAPRFLIEVYHYPFGQIAREHIESPEYSFKFGSDSALLAIHLYEAIQKPQQGSAPETEILPAASANPYLPTDILRSCVRLRIRSDSTLPSERIREIAAGLHKAFVSFREDEGSYMMGLLPEKVRRRCKPEDIRIMVSRYIRPEPEPSRAGVRSPRRETPQTTAVATAFPSYLFYIPGLERLTPYTFKAVNGAKDEKDFRYEMADGAFATSSLRGIVRTVPIKLEHYAPLENKYTAPPAVAPDAPSLDFVIEGATIFDGSRDHPRRVADVGIAGEVIAAVGDLKERQRATTIDGRGLFLTPGFIDIHSHVDSTIPEAADGASAIRQGITTMLGGNCSFSPLGIGSFCRDIETSGVAINIAMLIGNAPARETAIGRKRGQPSYEEVYCEKCLVDLGMEEGAFGMSSGLIYSISEQSYAWELAEMSKQLKPYGGFYATHTRGESEEALDAIREAIHIGELAEVPVQISHMKVINKRNWGDMGRYLDIMKEARARGLDVTGDQYPWRATGPAGHYRLYTLLVREAIKNDSPEVVFLKDMPGRYQKYSGRLLSELLAGEKMTPEELMADLSLTERTRIFAAYLCLSGDDLLLPMKEDFVMVCTDGSIVSSKELERGKGKDDHPRKFRTFPEFLAGYVRDRGVCPWELGIYKCTGLPAWRLGLADRGIIKPGACADLVLLDPQKLEAGADYRDQTPPPKGIMWVFVNGRPALKEGNLTGISSGRALYAGDRRKP